MTFLEDLDPLLAALIGGALIGAAAGALALLNGRVAGISGMAAFEAWQRARLGLAVPPDGARVSR